MKPKQKAKQIVKYYLPILDGYVDNVRTSLAKDCALVAVDVKLEDASGCMECGGTDLVYWQKVKIEILEIT